MARPKKTAPNDRSYTLRLPSELFKRLRQQAAEKDRPVNELVIEAIEKALPKGEGKAEFATA